MSTVTSKTIRSATKTRNNSNPYRSPRAAKSGVKTARSGYHGDRGVFLAAFLGGPLAGGILMAANFIHRDQPGDRPRSVVAILIGLAATAVIAGMFIMFQLPGGVATAISACVGVAASKVAKQAFAEQYEAMEKEQSRPVSLWYAAGIGLATALVPFSVFLFLSL